MFVYICGYGFNAVYLYRHMHLCAYMEARRDTRHSPLSLSSYFFEAKSQLQPKIHIYSAKWEDCQAQESPTFAPRQIMVPGICVL